MKELVFNNPKSYSVFITSGLKEFNIKCQALLGEKVAVIVDKKVYSLFGNPFSALLKDKKIFTIPVNSGEKSKCIKTYSKILNTLLEYNFARSDSIIAFGGGVIGDLAGFVASSYMRGIGYVSVPTTLLSMVDSCVGGKTGINLDKGKNLCGSFYPPRAVFINTDYINTLTASDINCGLGEILKYEFIDNSFKFIGVDEDCIYNCLKIKKDIVEKDFTDNSERKKLNFGHTFGHAIERASHFKIPHGECVIKGIRLSLIVSENYYKLSDKLVKNFDKRLSELNLNGDCKVKKEKLFKHVANDKKINGEFIDMLLIDKNNQMQIEKIQFEKLKDLL